MKKVKCLTLFLLVLLLSLPLLSCGSTVAPTSNASATQDSGTTAAGSAVNNSDSVTTTAKEPATTAAGNAAHIGDSVTCGDFTITLKGVEQSDGTVYLSPETGNVYVLFELEVKNNSADDAYFNSFYFDAYADDYSVESTWAVSFAKDGAKDISGTIAAGKKQIGYVAFEVAKDWQQMELHYRKITEKEKVIFEVTNPKQ